MHDEVFNELMGVEGATDYGPLFHGTPITTIEGPIPYGRIVASKVWCAGVNAVRRSPTMSLNGRAIG
jgi:hypothetical protein